jgi:hypothetical protein
MKETLKKYWRFLVGGGVLIAGWYFAGGPFWTWIILGLAIWGGPPLLDAILTKDQDVRFALFAGGLVGGGAFYFTKNRAFSFAFGLLVVVFYFGLKWVDNINKKRSARKQEPKKPIVEYRPKSGKCVLPGGVKLPTPTYVQKALDKEK